MRLALVRNKENRISEKNKDFVDCSVKDFYSQWIESALQDTCHPTTACSTRAEIGRKKVSHQKLEASSKKTKQNRPYAVQIIAPYHQGLMWREHHTCRAKAYAVDLSRIGTIVTIAKQWSAYSPVGIVRLPVLLACSTRSPAASHTVRTRVIDHLLQNRNLLACSVLQWDPPQTLFTRPQCGSHWMREPF